MLFTEPYFMLIQNETSPEGILTVFQLKIMLTCYYVLVIYRIWCQRLLESSREWLLYKMEEILNLLKSTPTLYLAAENIPIAGTCSIIIIEYDTMYYVLHNLNPQRLTS